MKRRRLFWLLTPRFLVLIIAIVASVIWQISSTFRSFYQSELEKTLETQANFFGQRIGELPTSKIREICNELGNKTDTRITVIDTSGIVIADSDKDAFSMDNHRNRPEIQDAFLHKRGVSVRYSQTLKEPMMYLAVLSNYENESQVVIRTALPMTSIDLTLENFYWRVIAGGGFIACLAIALSLWMVRRISLPLEQMKISAERFASGDLTQRLRIPEAEETAALAEALNRMAEELDGRIQVVIKQRGELESVLASMTEGVIAIDHDKRILRINQAAARYWNLNPEQVIGQYLFEVVRNADLAHFSEKALKSTQTVEEEFEIDNGNGRRILQVHGTVLATIGEGSLGALMVFSDVTRLKKLESMRRDFVANVSHELKTPITSIKGFTETLLDGALENPEDAERFVQIIQRQSNRLEAIISDLMMLSRLEQDDRLDDENLILADLVVVLDSARQACEYRAKEKGIVVDIQRPNNPVKTKINIQLLEQAVINLLVNAVNYSPEKSKITLMVEVEKNNDSVILKIVDRGAGISKEHLPRLFERFYRIDKGRSRDLGGTGLGLAIVKHIAQAHGGDVSVVSSIGEGSTFSIHLPLTIS